MLQFTKFVKFCTKTETRKLFFRVWRDHRAKDGHCGAAGCRSPADSRGRRSLTYTNTAFSLSQLTLLFYRCAVRTDVL